MSVSFWFLGRSYSAATVMLITATLLLESGVVASAPLGLTNTNPSSYTWDTLEVGKRAYIDRSYTYSDVPSAYDGLQLLQTANNDKKSAGDVFITFDIDQPVTVYVAHVFNATKTPSWLESWTFTGDRIINTDRPLYLYRKEFAAGTVILGGNNGAPSMYTVLVGTQDGGTLSLSVPNVVGLTQANAEAAIVAAGLVVGTITTVTSDTVPAGQVISQTPGGGTAVARGAAVDLTVSSASGAVPVPVPNVVGLTQANAEAATVAAGLVVGTITTVTSDTVPAGQVIGQTPGGGTAVARGAAVDLTVSSASGAATTARLSWVAPVTYTDGTPLLLSEIAGYRVYSGIDSNNLALVVDINDGSATSYTVTGLTSGTHYFSVTAFDYSNNESNYSDTASKTIP